MAREYTEEFKKQAIKLAKEVGTWAASKNLEIPKGTLDCWMHKERSGKIKIVEKSEENEAINKIRQENRELSEKIKIIEKENARLKKENEFLEEAASFFAVSRQKLKQN